MTKVSRRYEIYLILTFLQIGIIEYVSAIKCYRCGTLTPNQPIGNKTKPLLEPYTVGSSTQPPITISELESCAEFEKYETSKYPYVVECTDDPSSTKHRQICVKIVTYKAVDDTDKRDVAQAQKLFTQRGCAYAVTATGTEHPIGCGLLAIPEVSKKVGISNNIRELEHICYCDTNYCNSATAILKIHFQQVLTVNFLILLFYMLNYVWIQN